MLQSCSKGDKTRLIYAIDKQPKFRYQYLTQTSKDKKLVIEIFAVSAYLEFNARSKPYVTINPKAITLKEAGDWLESTQEIVNLYGKKIITLIIR